MPPVTSLRLASKPGDGLEAWLTAPRLSNHPVDVGQRSEAAILAELVRRGHRVRLPFGTNQRYDLVIEHDGKFLRCQCKTGRLIDGVVQFRPQSVRSNTSTTVFRSYLGEAELFLVYCPQNKRIYAVPVESAPSSLMYLRVAPTRNGQKDRIQWAKDYELPA